MCVQFVKLHVACSLHSGECGVTWARRYAAGAAVMMVVAILTELMLSLSFSLLLSLSPSLCLSFFLSLSIPSFLHACLFSLSFLAGLQHTQAAQAGSTGRL